MPKENKVLRMFTLLTDKYEVKVGKYPFQKKGDGNIVINVVDHGMRFAFDSKNYDYQTFLESIAKADLKMTLNTTDLRNLNLELETIAQIIQTNESCKNGSSCGCQLVDHVDDE